MFRVRSCVPFILKGFSRVISVINFIQSKLSLKQCWHIFLIFIFGLSLHGKAFPNFWKCIEKNTALYLTAYMFIDVKSNIKNDSDTSQDHFCRYNSFLDEIPARTICNCDHGTLKIARFQSVFEIFCWTETRVNVL